EVAEREHDVLRGIAEIADEAVAPVVERAAETRAAGLEFERVRDGIEGEIVAGEGNGFRVRLIDAVERTAVGAAGDVEAVVEAPDGIVEDGLDVELLEAGIDFLADVGDAVAISVLEIPEVGRGGDEDAAL